MKALTDLKIIVGEHWLSLLGFLYIASVLVRNGVRRQQKRERRFIAMAAIAVGYPGIAFSMSVCYHNFRLIQFCDYPYRLFLVNIEYNSALREFSKPGQSSSPFPILIPCIAAAISFAVGGRRGGGKRSK